MTRLEQLTQIMLVQSGSPAKLANICYEKHVPTGRHFILKKGEKLMTRMQTQTHTQSTNRVTNHSSTPNLDRAIDATPLGKITAALEKRKEGIEHLLPDFMKGQGDRCIARARQYWARSSRKLQGCTEASFVGCVLAAAELGFAIDGKLCYAVPFPTRVPGEKDRWEDKAQLIVRYSGLLGQVDFSRG